MDLAAIQGAISSLKLAADISRSMMDMKNMADVQGKVILLQSALLEAQNAALSATAAQFELQEKIRLLEAQLKDKGDWDTEKGRYLLVAPWHGPAQVYALRREDAKGEQPHYVCPSCYHSGKKKIMNPIKKNGGWIQMVCPSCKAEMDTGFRGVGAPKYAEEIQKND